MPLTLRAFSLLITFACLLAAQGTTSRVTGAVSDSSGASISGARLQLTNSETGVSFNSVSSDSGVFVFEAIQVGTYSLSAEQAGFKKWTGRNIRLNIGQPATVNIRMEVGAVTESVEVAESYEAVQTSSSGNFGNVFTEKVIKDLPIVGTRGRNPVDLVLRQPGVVSGSASGGGVHVRGSRDRAWNYTLDGIDMNETSAGGGNFTPIRVNPDMLAEFRVITGNATAEFGRSSGAQVAMVTKSGGNQIHGDAFWFYRTPRFNANEWENNINNIGKRQFVQNIWGGSVGGPIKKNKLFFYTNLQQLRARESAQVNRTVLTQSARQGIFRYNTAGRNQPSGVAGSAIDASGNVLPNINVATYNVVQNDPGRLGIDSTIRGLIDQTPLPNNFTGGDGLNTAFYTFTPLQREQQWDYTGKVDYILNEKNTLYGRYSIGRQNTLCDRGNGGQELFPGLPCPVNTYRDPQNFAANWRSNPTPTITNELVFGLNRFKFNFDNPFSSLDSPNYTLGVGLSSPVANFFNNVRQLNTWQLVENFSKFAGAHTIRAGANLRVSSHRDWRGTLAGLNASPEVNFDRTINVVDSAAFGLPAGINQAFDRSSLESYINTMLGRVGQQQQGLVASNGRFGRGLFEITTNYNEYDLYIQDTWKVRRNLTIDLGLRWELRPAVTANPSGDLYVPNRAVTAGSAPSNTLRWVNGSPWGSRNNNFGPSLGFAWDPFGTGKTSVRGNYRLSYDRIQTFLLSGNVVNATPGQTFAAIDRTFGQGGGRLRNLPAIATPTQTPEALRQPAAFSNASNAAFDPSLRMPTTHQWGLSIQREVMNKTVVEVSYFGRRAYGLQGAYNINQAEIQRNGFVDAFRTVQSGGESPLMNQLLGAWTGKPATESGSAFARRNFAANFANNSVGGLAATLATRTERGTSLADAAGLGPYFFYSFPQFAGGFNIIDSNDFSTYHGLEMQLERRFSNGFTGQISYTFSKSLDTRSFDPNFTTAATGTGQAASSTPFDNFNRKLNYAPSDFDRTHVVQSYWVYELPFGKGRRLLGNAARAVDYVIGGWQLGGLTTIQGGRPFTVFSGFNTFSNVVSSTANCNGCTRADGAVFQETAAGPSAGLIFYFNEADRARFSNPGPGQTGNLPRNFFRGPGSFNLDLSMKKSITMGELRALEIRADSTNVTNSPTFGFPTTTLSATTFGRIRDTVISGSRKIQLSLKFTF
jgi:hypothetical protein